MKIVQYYSILFNRVLKWYGHPDEQRKGEHRIEEDLTEFGPPRDLRVEVNRCRIHGQAGEEHVIRFGDGSRQGLG